MREGAITLGDLDTDTSGTAAPEPSPGGLEDLYRRQGPESVRLAFLLTHDRATAEDVAQEAFIRVAGRFRHLRSASSFDAYLRRTVINLCMSHHRRERVARRYLRREAERADGREPSESPPDVETRDELRAAMAALPDRQRAALALRFYLDLSEQQTADTLGCSVGAARSLVFRAMETLRERIGDQS
jgi:RNA polymerase sigma-70 factor (sigma-E family)